MRIETRTRSNGDALQAAIAGLTDERLLANIPAPLAVAFSGGGDSLALLLMTKAWADLNGRRLVALTVDHRLRPEGADWALRCRRRAEALGIEHHTLVWEGPKPETGLSAAARRARHALLAEAARRAGARVILMGHTADDLAEARAMREEGSTVPSPRLWSPSPAWPEGRGLFLLRPLLTARRAELRDLLAAWGEVWIDDPANIDPSSARARARRALSREITAEGAPDARLAVTGAQGALSGVVEGAAADLRLPAGWLGASADAHADLSAVLICAAGAERPPRREALTRLLDRIRSGEAFIATLAGARVVFDGATIHVVRDTSDRRRGPPADVELPTKQTIVWDGRFTLHAGAPGIRVGHLAGRAARLPSPLRAAVLETPAAARPALPLVIHPDGRLGCPTIRQSPEIEIRAITLERLTAARGMIMDEAALWRMAKARHPS